MAYTSISSPNNDSICDKMSSLPDHLLHQILSFLQTKQVLQTSLLSKRWKGLWRSVPTLNLDRISFPDQHKLELFVYRFLTMRDPHVLEQLSITWKFHEPERHVDLSLINSWIIYAMSHHVQLLDLKIGAFQLPPCLFTSSSLRVFKLEMSVATIFNLPTSIYLPALKTLHLISIIFYNNNDPEKGIIENLFSNCPVLETLLLHNCYFPCYKLLKICTPQLRNLDLDGFFCCPTIISTPSLVSLKLAVYCPLSKEFGFTDNPISLTDAFISMNCNKSRMQLIEVAQSAKTLSLSHEFLRSMVKVLQQNLHMFQCIQIPFHSLKCLKLKTEFNNDEVLVINTLLKYAANVETLLLKIDKINIFDRTESESWFEYRLAHLRIVKIEIQGFKRSGNAMKFVKFVLENAIVLEKMFIVGPKDVMFSDEMTKIKAELLNHPRASLNAEILLL